MTPEAIERRRIRAAAYHKEYYAKNRERIMARTKQWVADNREKAAGYQRIRRANRSQERRAADRICARDRSRARGAWLTEYKAERGCSRCPENFPACLDFHHREGEAKVKVVARMARSGTKWERVLAEIDKCDLLCANCHRKEHHTKKAVMHG